MTIHDIIRIANAVDPEAASFKANSTRDGRNAKWAEILSIVHYGHPVFNLTPDSSWFLKSAGSGRPQSDDVAVKLPKRDFWDCILNSGTDKAEFQATYAGKLPNNQVIITPERPNNPIPEPVPPVPAPEIPDYIQEFNKIFEQFKLLNDKLNNFASKSDIDLVNASIEDLRAHLNNKFAEVRNHQNMGRHKVGW